MKKLTAIFLTTLILIATLTACSGENVQNSSEIQKTQATPSYNPENSLAEKPLNFKDIAVEALFYNDGSSIILSPDAFLKVNDSIMFEIRYVHFLEFEYINPEDYPVIAYSEKGTEEVPDNIIFLRIYTNTEKAVNQQDYPTQCVYRDVIFYIENDDFIVLRQDDKQVWMGVTCKNLATWGQEQLNAITASK